MADYILGVDFSAHEGSAGVSDAVLKQCEVGGVRFLINRASLGTAYVDTSLVRNIRRAERLGWVTGGYHFLVRGRGAVQAERFVNAMKKVPGGLKDRLAVLDVEWAGSDRMAWPTYKDVEEFAERFFQLTGNHNLIIYTAEAYWTGAKIGNQPGKKFGPLWQARWTGGEPVDNVTLPDKPPVAGFGGWNGRPPLWQFGQLRLKAGGVDGNAWYGTIEELRELTGLRREAAADAAYENGYAAGIAAIWASIPDVKVPGPDTKAYRRGVADAREVSANAVAALKDAPGKRAEPPTEVTPDPATEVTPDPEPVVEVAAVESPAADTPAEEAQA